MTFANLELNEAQGWILVVLAREVYGEIGDAVVFADGDYASNYEMEVFSLGYKPCKSHRIVYLGDEFGQEMCEMEAFTAIEGVVVPMR